MMKKRIANTVLAGMFILTVAAGAFAEEQAVTAHVQGIAARDSYILVYIDTTLVAANQGACDGDQTTVVFQVDENTSATGKLMLDLAELALTTGFQVALRVEGCSQSGGSGSPGENVFFPKVKKIRLYNGP